MCRVAKTVDHGCSSSIYPIGPRPKAVDLRWCTCSVVTRACSATPRPTTFFFLSTRHSGTSRLLLALAHALYWSALCFSRGENVSMEFCASTSDVQRRSERTRWKPTSAFTMLRLLAGFFRRCLSRHFWMPQGLAPHSCFMPICMQRLD